MISGSFTADEIECLVRTAGEAVCGQLDDLSARQRSLAERAYQILMAGDLPPAATTSPVRHEDPGGTVWVLRHEDKHGDDVSLYAGHDAGLGALAQTVRSRWDNITGNPGVPATPDALDDQAAADMYFIHRGGLESYWLYEDTVSGIADTRRRTTSLDSG